jgi:hypothetical protein
MKQVQLVQDQLSVSEQPVSHASRKTKYNRRHYKCHVQYLVLRNRLTRTGSLGSINSTLATATGVSISPVIVGCKGSARFIMTPDVLLTMKCWLTCIRMTVIHTSFYGATHCSWYRKIRELVHIWLGVVRLDSHKQYTTMCFKKKYMRKLWQKKWPWRHLKRLVLILMFLAFNILPNKYCPYHVKTVFYSDFTSRLISTLKH